MKRHQQWKGAAIVASLLLLGGSQVLAEREQTRSQSNVPLPQRIAQPSKPVNPKLVAANTRFGFKLFSELLPQAKGKNVFVSPSSVAIALGMLYNGAAGKTQQGIAKALELQGMGLAELNQSNAGLKALLENPDPKVQLAIANSLWGRQGVDFKPEFLRQNQQFYKAQITALDFDNPRSLKTINQWVSQATRGKITEILDQIQPDDALFLINAIYFKGAWSQPFEKSQTRDRPFYLADGKTKPHPRMVQSGDYRYYETPEFQAVSLPYGQNQRMSLYVFLPKQASSLTSFYKTLTAEQWQQWTRQFRNRPGTIELPRFKLEYEVKLNSALTALGMGSAFERSANFSNLGNVPMQIDEVKHKTFVEVNEEGTEAAAVTSIGIRITSAPVPQKPFNLVVDRPFFCALQDNQTGTVLFMGSIVEPK